MRSAPHRSNEVRISGSGEHPELCKSAIYQTRNLAVREGLTDTSACPSENQRLTKNARLPCAAGMCRKLQRDSHERSKGNRSLIKFAHMKLRQIKAIFTGSMSLA